MEQIECRPSMLKLTGLLFLTAIMVAAAYFCTTIGKPMATVFGWLGVVFFSLGFVVIPKAMLRGSSLVIIVGPDGIEDRQGGYGLIRWDDIESLTVRSVHGTRLLCVNVKDEARYADGTSFARELGSAANKSLGFSTITLGFVGLTPGLDDVLAYASRLGMSCDGEL